MNVESKRVEAIVKLYHLEMMGHLHILFAGDVQTSDRISKRRQELDLEIRNLLKTKLGKSRR